MTERLKNCPSCGGELDDNGRCLYCKSKVYDLTDISIDVNSRDRIKLKLKCGENTIIMDCYPANISWERSCAPQVYTDMDGSVYLQGNSENRITLELVSYGLY